jgi:uncharacterized protein
MSQPPESRKCAVCGKPQAPEVRPFCSKRCADVDLARWFGERYTLPAEEPPDGISGPSDEVE